MLRQVAVKLIFSLGVSALVSLVLPVAGCTPNYPACRNDEDCNRDEKRKVHEYCVNQLCQQCRDTKDCPEGQQCQKGRCADIPGWCKNDDGCANGEVCLDNKCQGCTSDGQCGEGGKCKQGKCLRKGQCDSDEDCPQDQDCKGGRCVPAAPKNASQEAPCKLAPVYFDFNESVLTTDATAAIDANAQCLKLVGRAVELIGRSDPRGTEEYNLALSERRALSVKARLQRLGIGSNKLRTLPKGELEATGKDEAGWAQDRRVDSQWQ